ncbi:MAG: ribosome-binding factor A [Candidatus Moranbacteria bacterium RIFCSPHIGHO2_01_FULL_55_24]|nr:MAG: ribosome-binding factor A [Candidatus Moranbacteria bacterium RIFCSPHIGHO2_01_FULL_55_24]
MSLRITKVNELIRDLVSETINTDLSLKPGVFVTLTKCETSKDLRHARIFVSIFPESETRYATETLAKERARIERNVHQKLYMKPLPKISFHVDTTAQSADEVEKLLKKIF